MYQQKIEQQAAERNVDLPSKGNNHNSDNLLFEIAKVYVQLQALHQRGVHLWPEDDDALCLCMERLQDAVLTMDINSPEECLALQSIFQNEFDLEKGEGPYQVMKLKVFHYSRQLVQEQ